MSRVGKLLLILLIPVVLYGAAKVLLYYKAKSAVDDLVTAASPHAAVRYADIATELSGAVTVSQITVQPHGQPDSIGIDSVRISSDDPTFFFHGARWQPGENAPPPRLAFSASGISLPLDAMTPPGESSAGGPCAQGMTTDPALLRQMGFAELHMDISGSYDLDETNRSLAVGFDLDLRDIESVHFDAMFADVDVEALSNGGATQISLGELGMAVRVDPAFGRQLLKTCAIGTDEPVHAWSERLAEHSLRQFAAQGLQLGPGLSGAVRDFYRDWGEFEVAANPSKPVGLFSLMFVPPDQLVPMLGVRMSLNGEPVVDTGFTWQRPDVQGLSALFGAEPEEDDAPQGEKAPQRILVRRQYENIAVGDIDGFVDHRVRVKPRGQPQREGVLKRIVRGEAEIEQNLYGGKFTVYVPVTQIESLQALTQHQISAGGR